MLTLFRFLLCLCTFYFLNWCKIKLIIVFILKSICLKLYVNHKLFFFSKNTLKSSGFHAKSSSLWLEWRESWPAVNCYFFFFFYVVLPWEESMTDPRNHFLFIRSHNKEVTAKAADVDEGQFMFKSSKMTDYVDLFLLFIEPPNKQHSFIL